MHRYVAVIDLGKTNSKVALVDTALCVEVEIIKQPSPVDTQSLYPCLDHQAIEAFIIDALRILSSKHRIDAITVTTHGATAALVKGSGELALPIIDYEFTGIDELREEYEQHRPSFTLTGSPRLPGGLNVGAQLYWQQKNYNDQFTRANSVLTWPQYWVFKLTGQRHNDVSSLGCHTDLYEPKHQRYSKLVSNMQWQSLMPPTKHSGHLSGPLNSSIATQTELSAAIPVYTGIHDSNASLVPHLINHEPPFSVVSTGTWIVSMAIGGKPVVLDETRDTLINVNARGESFPTALFMGGRERDLLGLTTSVTEMEMDKMLEDVHRAPMMLPSVVANTGPYPNAKQQWISRSDKDSRVSQDSQSVKKKPADEINSQDRACAITLYLALMTHECLLLIGADGPTYLEGPLAHDHQYAQTLAAVSGRQVLISDSETGTSIGAAMLISAPSEQPKYSLVKVDDSKRVKLQQYAKRWKEELSDHSK